MQNEKYTYNFETSQPLTPYQIDWLNNIIVNELISQKEDLSDIPEWTTVLELQD